MTDIATPNLPSRDFETTASFYARLGFAYGYRDDGWMILHRGPRGSRAVLEFFPHAELNPTESWFSACIRLDDLASMVQQLEASEVPEGGTGIPRFHRSKTQASGLTIAYLVDPDGSLIRLIQND